MNRYSFKVFTIVVGFVLVALLLPSGRMQSVSGQSGRTVPTATPTPDPQGPTITGFSPTSGPPGTRVIITGTNLWNATRVTINGASVNYTVNSSTKITAIVRSSTTSGKIEVTTRRGTATSADDFLVVVPAPTISGFSPRSGPVGTNVTINGTHFNGATNVMFNGVEASSFTLVSATQIKAVVPVGATTGVISVMTPGGTATSGTNFTVTTSVKPTISGFSPASAPRGATIVINGTNFTGATRVVFNSGKNATPTVLSDTQIQVVVPAGATTGKVKVTTPNGTATSGSNFTVILPPAVTGFSPTGGTPGTTVTITGRRFVDGATTVQFGTVPATNVTFISSSRITAQVPVMAAGGVRITVTTPGGSGRSSSNFRVR